MNSVTEEYCHFGAARRVVLVTWLAHSLTLKTEAVQYSKTSVNFYQTIHQIPEDSTFHNYHLQNIKCKNLSCHANHSSYSTYEELHTFNERAKGMLWVNTIQITVFWYVIPLVAQQQEGVVSSEMLVSIHDCQTTWHHTPEDSNLQSLLWGPQISHKILVNFTQKHQIKLSGMYT
jgi:hypothetical protein